jgi:NAD(P)-dependent dehydrogenase (short-subunit alcohol dehydrogenase family)
MLLAGKVAVISGAASPRGIGLATARLLAAQGARVAILDLDEAAAQEAAAGLEHFRFSQTHSRSFRGSCGIRLG